MMHGQKKHQIRTYPMFIIKVKEKVKQSRYRPGVAQRVPGS
jgi:anaerobic ribonucleoside-triphosphate reductase